MLELLSLYTEVMLKKAPPVGVLNATTPFVRLFGYDSAHA